MSPSDALIYVDNIRDAFVAIRPGQRRHLRRQRGGLQGRRSTRRDRADPRSELAAIPEDQRWLVTSEGAFSYLARDFGLEEAYLWPINADQQGTPQQVRKVIDAVRENDIPARLLRKHRFNQRRPSRSPAKPAPRMAACSMSTR